MPRAKVVKRKQAPQEPRELVIEQIVLALVERLGTIKLPFTHDEALSAVFRFADRTSRYCYEKTPAKKRALFRSQVRHALLRMMPLEQRKLS